ncbi:hypothetical protein [Granulicella aggregans]|jgi:hypothetical protein|uniref:hypothetical protein n=1 Tax=Granulicella aggregans TaxID=474949 RepID=UPI0021E01AE2|nr:hypothetical protein [Granulicella aggregans]
MRQIVFLFIVGAFVSTLIGITLYFILRARRASKNAWRMILGRLRQIDRDKFAEVALDLLDDREDERHLEPDRIFEMIGGMNGLDALEENCDVLIDLATYVQRWYPDALQLSEELRLNAREIKWHIGRLRGASATGHLREQFPVYAQRAVATYYLMTRSLLVLYEGVKLPELAELQQAL